MLQIKTTPNLYGITILGDYQDLNILYNSISRYLSFYIDQLGDGYPYHEYEYLLSLNYDIRHAYMGDRETQLMENNAENVGIIAENIFEIPAEEKKQNRDIRRSHKNGNLYFGVNILYPLIFHYLIAFDNILQDEPCPKTFSNLENSGEPWMTDYTFFDAMADQTQIRHFIALLWKNVQDLLGIKRTSPIYSYLEEADYMVPLSLYCDTLLHCQMRSFPMLSSEEKLQFLELCLYNIIDCEDLLSAPSDYPDSFARYEECLNSLNKKEKLPVFPEKKLFYNLLEKNFPVGTPLYKDNFDTFLEKTYGVADDEDPDW